MRTTSILFCLLLFGQTITSQTLVSNLNKLAHPEHYSYFQNIHHFNFENIDYCLYKAQNYIVLVNLSEEQPNMKMIDMGFSCFALGDHFIMENNLYVRSCYGIMEVDLQTAELKNTIEIPGGSVEAISPDGRGGINFVYKIDRSLVGYLDIETGLITTKGIEEYSAFSLANNTIATINSDRTRMDLHDLRDDEQSSLSGLSEVAFVMQSSSSDYSYFTDEGGALRRYDKDNTIQEVCSQQLHTNSNTGFITNNLWLRPMNYDTGVNVTSWEILQLQNCEFLDTIDLEQGEELHTKSNIAANGETILYSTQKLFTIGQDIGTLTRFPFSNQGLYQRMVSGDNLYAFIQKDNFDITLSKTNYLTGIQTEEPTGLINGNIQSAIFTSINGLQLHLEINSALTTISYDDNLTEVNKSIRSKTINFGAHRSALRNWHYIGNQPFAYRYKDLIGLTNDSISVIIDEPLKRDIIFANDTLYAIVQRDSGDYFIAATAGQLIAERNVVIERSSYLTKWDNQVFLVNFDKALPLYPISSASEIDLPFTVEYILQQANNTVLICTKEQDLTSKIIRYDGQSMQTIVGEGQPSFSTPVPIWTNGEQYTIHLHKTADKTMIYSIHNRTGELMFLSEHDFLSSGQVLRNRTFQDWQMFTFDYPEQTTVFVTNGIEHQTFDISQVDSQLDFLFNASYEEGILYYTNQDDIVYRVNVDGSTDRILEELYPLRVKNIIQKGDRLYIFSADYTETVLASASLDLTDLEIINRWKNPNTNKNNFVRSSYFLDHLSDTQILCVIKEEAKNQKLWVLNTTDKSTLPLEELTGKEIGSFGEFQFKHNSDLYFSAVKDTLQTQFYKIGIVEDGSLLVDGPSHSEIIVAYPNPTTDYLFIDNSVLSVVIVDQLGIVHESKTELIGAKTKIDVSSLRAGLYFISFVTSDGTQQSTPFYRG